MIYDVAVVTKMIKMLKGKTAKGTQQEAVYQRKLQVTSYDGNSTIPAATMTTMMSSNSRSDKKIDSKNEKKILV